MPRVAYWIKSFFMSEFTRLKKSETGQECQKGITEETPEADRPDYWNVWVCYTG